MISSAMLRTVVVTVMLMVPFPAAAAAPIDLQVFMSCKGHAFIPADGGPGVAGTPVVASVRLGGGQVMIQTIPSGFASGPILGTKNGMFQFTVQQTSIQFQALAPQWGMVANGKGPLFIGFGPPGMTDEISYRLSCSPAKPRPSRRRH